MQLGIGSLKVASGDSSFANTKNCAQFFTPRPHAPRHSELPAGHATELVASRLSAYVFTPSGTSY